MKIKLSALLLVLLIVLTGCSSLVGYTPAGDSATAQSGLTVYYLDVGQADSALVVCGDESMLLDGGNAADSDLIYAFLKEHSIEHLDYMVATHAHEDHIGGLSGALNYATVGTAFCPVTEHDSRVFENFVTYLAKQDVAITVPSPGDTFTLGEAVVEILAPVTEYDEPNDTSIVLKIEYSDTSFLFTGDAERPAEQDILEMGYDLSATVLKAGHHGSDTATTYPFLREIMPEYAVISCGEGNNYGHPHDDLLSRLRDADVTVYRTDLQGTITCVSDGNTVSLTTERNANSHTNSTAPTNTPAISDFPSVSSSTEPTVNEYIGNKNSHVFHLLSCPNLPAEQNRVLFSSREEAVGQDYTPCGNCEP